MDFIDDFSQTVINSIESIEKSSINNFIDALKNLKFKKGRVFVAGVGGSAANASHLTNDFRKLTGIETYSISENVSELTARINDESWEESYVGYLKVSNFNENDILIVLSVGGGSKDRNVSLNLVKAIDYAKSINSKSLAIVSHLGGYAKDHCDICLIINVNKSEYITPISETLQSYLWHMIVTHKDLKLNDTKW